MRLSDVYAPTLKEDPAEAEIVSHRLLLRAGMLRKVAAGIYTWLPLGLSVLRRVEQVIREEMNAVGAQEILMPALQPAELWEKSGRWEKYGPEMMRLTDRAGREMGLGPTHEELVTDLVTGELRSYKQLPTTVYQIQAKYRDEIRPRFGLMRGREFLMKDAYAFCANEAQVDASYEDMSRAYSRVVERCGLAYKVVEAESGLIGGDVSQEFMVIAETGEEGIAYCDGCDYAANLDLATRKMPANRGGQCPAAEKVHTPAKRSIEEVSEFLGVEPAVLVKTLIYATDDGLVAILVPGDRDAAPLKVERVVGTAELLPETAFAEHGLTCGFVGPVGIDKGKVRVIADEALRDRCDVVVGANEADHHLAHVAVGRDFKPETFVDLAFVRESDECPRCSEPLRVARGIEVGHIFKLGTKYSEAMGATFLDENGKATPFVMGCYGIGVSRMVAAAIEQCHDEKGIVWPMSLAPYQVLVVLLGTADETQRALARRLADEVEEAGLDVLLDDRAESPGRKFADAELIGIPLQIVVGKKAADGVVELRHRKGLSSKDVGADDVLAEVAAAAAELESEVEPSTSRRESGSDG